RTAETERRKPEAKNADGTEPKDRTGKGKLEAARGKMEWAEELLDQERPLRLNQLQRIYSELLGVKEEAPEPCGRCGLSLGAAGLRLQLLRPAQTGGTLPAHPGGTAARPKRCLFEPGCVPHRCRLL